MRENLISYLVLICQYLLLRVTSANQCPELEDQDKVLHKRDGFLTFLPHLTLAVSAS